MSWIIERELFLEGILFGNISTRINRIFQIQIAKSKPYNIVKLCKKPKIIYLFIFLIFA